MSGFIFDIPGSHINLDYNPIKIEEEPEILK